MAYLVIETTENEVKRLCRAISESGLIGKERRVRIISEKAPNYNLVTEAIDRGTGRTTRMLQEVVSQVCGLTVVIAANTNECVRMRDIVLDLLDGRGRTGGTRSGPWFVSIGKTSKKIMFIPLTIDRHPLRGIRAERVFVDHYAYESNRAGCDRLYNILRR